MSKSLTYSGISTLLGGLLLGGCVLTGIEPDEIDIADEGTESGALTGDGSDEGAEGDPAGDGDGDPTGDGDGETGDPTTGDGDGDPTTGDGDGDGDGDDTSCLGFSPGELVEGENPVSVADQASELSPSCGGAGPESVYRFVAPAEGEWQFAVTASEFDEVLALVNACVPLDELGCSPTPASLSQFLLQGQIVYIVVDSDNGTGAATLEISML